MSCNEKEYTDAHARFLFSLPPKGDEYLIKLESYEKKRRREWHFALQISLASFVLINKEKYRICSSLSRAWWESIWWISLEAKVFFLVRRLNILKASFFFFRLQGAWERKVTWRSYLSHWLLSNTRVQLEFLHLFQTLPFTYNNIHQEKVCLTKRFEISNEESKLYRVSYRIF